MSRQTTEAIVSSTIKPLPPQVISPGELTELSEILAGVAQSDALAQRSILCDSTGLCSTNGYRKERAGSWLSTITEEEQMSVENDIGNCGFCR